MTGILTLISSFQEILTTGYISQFTLNRQTQTNIQQIGMCLYRREFESYIDLHAQPVSIFVLHTSWRRMSMAHMGERASGRSRSSGAASTQTTGQERLGSDDRDQDPLPDLTQTLSQELPGYLAPLSSVWSVSVSTGQADRKRKRQSGSQKSQDDGRPSTSFIRPAKRSRKASGRSRSSGAASTQTTGQERLGSDDRDQDPLPDLTQTLSQELPGYLAPLSSVLSVSVSTGQADRKRKRQSGSQRSQDDGRPSNSFKRPAKRSRKEAYAKGPLLGRGGFGSVYAGIRRSDRLPVAIKYVSKDRTQERLKVEGQGLLPLEVALMTRVNAAPACPNVLQLVEWFDRRSRYSMILERPVPCQDLLSFCEENGCVDESLAKKVLVQLITALKHCESRGVLHRDVKPENLLISTASHDIKLLDFGCGDLIKDSAYTYYAEINFCFYEIGIRLGVGGFGTVYAATRLEDGFQVAVKFAYNDEALRKRRSCASLELS
ncbi:uncharacterized protein LOC143750739 [Siphateles boraxobius]|uniref:uncharacterized protein LOC143750739 n=1 Tax=Siphateles boraxobius TaxID=180520 RepID=UPI0040633BF1